jgi:hypothetical protein
MTISRRAILIILQHSGMTEAMVAVAVECCVLFVMIYRAFTYQNLSLQLLKHFGCYFAPTECQDLSHILQYVLSTTLQTSPLSIAET